MAPDCATAAMGDLYIQRVLRACDFNLKVVIAKPGDRPFRAFQNILPFTIREFRKPLFLTHWLGFNRLCGLCSGGGTHETWY